MGSISGASRPASAAPYNRLREASRHATVCGPCGPSRPSIGPQPRARAPRGPASRAAMGSMSGASRPASAAPSNGLRESSRHATVCGPCGPDTRGTERPVAPREGSARAVVARRGSSERLATDAAAGSARSGEDREGSHRLECGGVREARRRATRARRSADERRKGRVAGAGGAERDLRGRAALDLRVDGVVKGQPDHLGWCTTHCAQTFEVLVTGDEHESMIAGEGPDILVAGAWAGASRTCADPG